MVTAFRRYSRSSFFKPPINDSLGSNSRVLKAWLSYPEGSKDFPSICNDYGSPIATGDNPGWGSLAADRLSKLADDVDAITGAVSDIRFVQSFPPSTLLIKHDDKRKSSRVVGLAGVGEFNLYDTQNPEQLVESIHIGPGDVLHFSGVGLHSAVNGSASTYRETLNLIDI